MQEILEIKELNTEDIKFLKRKLKKGYILLVLLALFSIVLPIYLIYLAVQKQDNEDKGFAILMILVVFGFWIYITIQALITVLERKRGLFFQKKIEGNVKVLKKEIVTHEGYDSDTISHEITIYSPIEEKYRNVSIYERDYQKIETGDFISITYFTMNTSIKALIFKDKNLKYKSFTTQRNVL
ncbi:hypothetical protein GCM10022422_24670 [Flavobacterium ginsengisoli]|uniref:YcxB-like protein domain-containing protein n=1 Tax=Flavobacterium ginsengisoli TaxID=871694 RepID=A0ABP7FND2_9FLAO|nr:hypothetical protein [Flavobacterium ginsengisoli]